LKQNFDKYAEYYDLIYSDKDYEAECDFLEELFSRYSEKTPRNILDVGCGTGGHLLRLLQRNYKVSGVDASQSMVNAALGKLRKLNLNCEIRVANAWDFKFGNLFDAATCMFAVMSYVINTDKLLETFRNIRRHLKKNSLFTFDFWYGPAVLAIRPSARIKIMDNPDTRVIRAVTPEMNTYDNTVSSHYYFLILRQGKVIDEFRETHVLRYLFPQEMLYFLRESSFEVLGLCEFMNIDNKPSENTWNVSVVAKAV
jgi:ubiquinone/menaquinone biosynthesis C-methylase UbiE